jgi:MoaA/NifB/PqqE/SkfB family radical SAM enzyme
MSPRRLPDRLNLAIARRCPVSCNGCYTFFGRDEPDLDALLASVAVFVRLGVSCVTVSGGDPLTIANLPAFLRGLRSVGATSIKVDTVGVGLSRGIDDAGGPGWQVAELMDAIDFLGIPLDGWSNESVLQFRRGRRSLYSETVALLDTLDRLDGPPRVIVNTVAHRANLPCLDRISLEVRRHRAVCHWNIFQYTPTDQARAGANDRFFVSDEAFARTALTSGFAAAHAGGAGPRVEFRSATSRLGQYLLVNSDGEAWLPDAAGYTIPLGPVFGAEKSVLERWEDAAATLQKTTPRRTLPVTEQGFAGVA